MTATPPPSAIIAAFCATALACVRNPVTTATVRVADCRAFPDGRIARNSADLEQRHGDECPSLIDYYSLDDVLAVVEPDEV